jgi:DNA mismatch repair ATPase MutS
MRTFNVLKQGIFNYQFLIKTMARPSSKPNSAQKGAPIVTPLMQQYYQAKAKYPDALLLFRVGDFYETFGEDAVTTSQVVGIVLTSRNNGGNDVELAGFPYHSLDVYLPKLVRAGYRVAICEQLEKPVAGRVVRRGVTEVITPGVTSDDKLLDQKSNNYLAVIARANKIQALRYWIFRQASCSLLRGIGRIWIKFYRRFHLPKLCFQRVFQRIL